MKIFKHILEKIKKVFSRKETVSMIEESKKTYEQKSDKFIETIKVKPINRNKKKVETDICFGDGLGIKKKMEW